MKKWNDYDKGALKELIGLGLTYKAIADMLDRTPRAIERKSQYMGLNYNPVFYCELNCSNCKKKFKKEFHRFKKSKNNFCSQSCSATYNNKHKTHGTRRSKLEAYIEEQLPSYFPDLEIIYNGKEAIGSELDIYIPSLKLAFELNGIFHYEPIFGETKLTQIQQNDKSKMKSCINNKIDLCIIDVSTLSYFKPKNAQKYLNIVVNIIEDRMKNNFWV